MAKTGKTLGRYLSKIGGWFKKNSAEICMGVGAGSLVASTVLAVKATPDAMKAIEEEKEKQNLSEEEKLPFKDKVRVSYKYYIPAAGAMAGGLTGVGVGTHIYRKQRKELQAKTVSLGLALGAAEAGIATYQNEVKERLGEEAAEEIFGKAKEDATEYVRQQERINESKHTIRDVDATGDGDQLFYDRFTGSFFRSSSEAIYTAAAQTNTIITGNPEPCASYNDFLDYCNRRSCAFAEQFGWNLYAFLDDRKGQGPIWPKIVNRGVTAPWGEPALSLEFERDPICPYK